MKPNKRILADRDRLKRLCGPLPEVEWESKTGQHTAFIVRKKKFAWHLIDHHGNGRVEFQCKAAPGVNRHLVEREPDRFFMPPYMAHHGWVGLYIDRGPVDWAEIEELLTDAYVLTAPKRLAAQAADHPAT